jgi:hypothetical protein
MTPVLNIQEFMLENFDRVDSRYQTAVRLGLVITIHHSALGRDKTANILDMLSEIVGEDPKHMAADIEKLFHYIDGRV